MTENYESLGNDAPTRLELIPPPNASNERNGYESLARIVWPERTIAIDPPLLSRATQEALVDAARDRAPIEGLTHTFYRYPARFPPRMVRAAIEAFTQPGELIYDPFVGGGTTLVEAMACQRPSIGSDISTLAAFVAQVKTTILDDDALDELALWAATSASNINIHGPTPAFDTWEEAGYFKHLGQGSRWRLRKALAQCVAAVEECSSPAVERFARCVILRTAQWALDGRRTVPSIQEFRRMLVTSCSEMIAGMRRLRTCAGDAASPATIFNRSAVGIDQDDLLIATGQPKLVMTSPPYPGVHVLYHRWQIDGRRETGAPFWIANALDGSGASYYTMGDRKRPGQETYFETIRRSLASVAKICADDAIFVQVVAFAQPEWQLPRYLEAAAEAGLEEFRLPILADEADGRLWRDVPNRRWYADQRGQTPGSKEVMLFHRVVRS